MKTKIFLTAIIATMVMFSSCQKAMEEITQLDFERIFIPTGLGVEMVQIPSAAPPTTMSLTTTFVWNRSTNPDVITYRFQLSTDSIFETIVFEVELDDLTTLQLLENLSFDSPYAARVMAVAPEGADEDDSKWNELIFRTPFENLFLPFEARAVRSRMANLRWHVSDVTRYTIASPGQQTESFNLPAEAIETGLLTISGLNPSTQYTITLFRGLQRRGQVQFTTNPGFSCEADNVLCLPIDGNLREAMENPDNIGKVILLPPGFETTITGAIAIAGTMHIFGDADADELPRIIFAGTGAGNHIFTLPETADYLIFENVEVIGQDNGGAPFYYITNQTTPTAVGTLRFENTVFTNFGEGGIRFQGNPAGQSIENLIINNSIFSGFGHQNLADGRFAFISVTVNTGRIDNIVFTNSTFFDMHHSFMNIQGSAPHQVVNTITIENATFDRIVTSRTASDRYFIDGHTHSNIRIEIRNAIFGSTNGPLARGIRISPESPNIFVENSFRTTDWETTNPIVGDPPPNFDIPNLGVFGGGRTNLFRNPDSGDFHLNNSVTGEITTAGDPRWRP